MLEDTHVGTGLLNSPPENIVIVFSTLEPIFAEPLFTGIKYGSPASENYMMIEPLFSESLGISKVNNNLSPSGVFTECYQSSLYRTCRTKSNHTSTPSPSISNVVADSENINDNYVDTGKRIDRTTNGEDDVTVLPEYLKSFSQTILLTSARRKRLRSLCNEAVWRAIKMLGGWVCIILLVFWLSSILGLSTFPANPLKSFLQEKKKKEKKSKSKKLKKSPEEDDDNDKSKVPNICYEEIYKFSRWDKFTEGRPKTHIFHHGRTYTYEKLPPYPKTKPKKPKTKKMSVKNSVAPSSSSVNIVSAPESHLCESIVPISCDYSILSTSVLNPLANAFNSSQGDIDCCATLRSLRMNNTGNIIIGHLNINSLRNKFDSLVELIKGNLDILIIGETKLDKTFPDEQFKINGFKKPYRKDRNEHGGGVMIYVRNDIPSQEKDYKLPSNVEGVLVEINLRKMKFLLIGVYHSTNAEHGTSDDVFLHELGTCLDVHSSYDNFLIAGDFNMQEHNTKLNDFLDEFHTKCLVKEPTCFKNPENPSCVDLFITNFPRSFMKTTTCTTGLSDFHKMIITVMRTTFPKAEPQIIRYRDCSKFNSDNFNRDLEKELKKTSISI